MVFENIYYWKYLSFMQPQGQRYQSLVIKKKFVIILDHGNYERPSELRICLHLVTRNVAKLHCHVPNYVCEVFLVLTEHVSDEL